MNQYIVERTLPGITPDALRQAAHAAKQTSLTLNAGGESVRYVRSTFVPDGDRVYCLFEAEQQETVHRVQDEAQLPFDRILPAAFLTAEDV